MAVIYINKTGGSSISVGVSVAWEAVGFSISVTPGSVTTKVDYGVKIPADNYYHKIYSNKNYQVKRYKHIYYEPLHPERETIIYSNTYTFLSERFYDKIVY